MQIVIDIPKEMWEWLHIGFLDEDDGKHAINAILKGTPLPKGHGRLIDKDHMIARLEAESKFFGGENADAFDERFSHGLKEAAIKVAEEPTIIEADEAESEDKCKNCKYYRNPDYTRCHKCEAESEDCN